MSEPFADDHESRLRRLEDIVARQDERNRNYEDLIRIVAKHQESIHNLWAAIGQVKLRVGFLVAGVGLVAGIFSGVVTSMINRALTPAQVPIATPRGP